MTEDVKARRQLALRGPRHAGYEVGYGKPPETTRFKKGQSGNPRGRPRGARNKAPALNEERMKSLVLAEAYRLIKVNDGNRQVSVPMAQAVIRAIAVAAARGERRAQELFTTLVSTTERENKALHDQYLDAALEYKVQWDRELRRREQLGITDLPPPLPHPDDVVVNMRTGEIKLKGPATKEEQQLWESAQQLKAECDEFIAELEADLAQDPEPPLKVQMLSELERQRYIRRLTTQFFPDRHPFDRL
jgi:hypothetical protein